MTNLALQNHRIRTQQLKKQRVQNLQALALIAVFILAAGMLTLNTLHYARLNIINSYMQGTCEHVGNAQGAQWYECPTT